MGKAIKKFGWKRNDLVVSTKINWGAANGDNPVNNGGLSRKHLIEGTDASLKRLDLEYGMFRARSLVEDCEADRIDSRPHLCSPT